MTIPKEVKTPVSVYLDSVDVRRLRVAEGKLDRSRSYLVQLAVREYLDGLGILDPELNAATPERGSDAGAATERQRRTRR